MWKIFSFLTIAKYDYTVLNAMLRFDDYFYNIIVFTFQTLNPFKDSQPVFTLSNEEIETIPVDLIDQNETVRFSHVFVVASRSEKTIFQILNYSIIKLKSNC